MANGIFSGDGTLESPYLIEDAQDINAINPKLSENPFVYFKMTNDIDMTLEGFKMIGNTSEGPPLMGEFDGDGHTLSGINMVKDPGSYDSSFAVFGQMSGDKAVVKNIIIKDMTITLESSDSAALIVANTSGPCLIENCYAEGTIEAKQAFVGGIGAYLSNSTIRNVTVKLNGSGHKVGGIIYSASDCIIENCSATGDVKGYNDYSSLSATINTTSGETKIKNIVSTINIENKYNGEFNYSKLVPFFDTESESTTIENSFVALNGLLYSDWSEFYAYYKDKIVKGTDGKLYKCTSYQVAENTSFRPIDGGNWAEHWHPIEIENTLTPVQLKNQNNYVGWDFENTWVITSSGPVLKLFYVEEVEPGGDNGSGNSGNKDPVDIVIVTDVDFSKTKLIRDVLESPIPQVWDHENEQFVPLTLQMIELMIKR